MARKRVAIIGNCQAAPLAGLLSAMRPDLKFVPPTAVHRIDASEVAGFLAALDQYEAVVMQPVRAGYRDNVGIDTDNVRNHMKPDQRLVLIPNLHFEGFLPTWGYMLYKDGNLRGKTPPGFLPEAASQGIFATLPRTDYQCFFLLCAWLQGWTAGRTAAVLEKPFDSDLVRSWHADSLAEFAKRESSLDTRMAPVLQSIAAHPEYEFYSFNHPNKALLTVLALQVLEVLDGGELTEKEVKTFTKRTEELPDRLARTSLPIYPFVASSLGMKSRAIVKIKQQVFPLPEFVSNSFAFFDCLGRDGLMVNANLPKFKLAEKLLETCPAA